jgi:hypothetical protein
LFSVASRTIRKAFWLLSIGLHVWASNCACTSDPASRRLGLIDLNCILQNWQTPKTLGVSLRTIRSSLLAMPTVYERCLRDSRSVEIKRHQYR